MLNRIRIADHFFLDEFDSPDTGTVKLDPRLVLKLDELRRRLGRPVIVLSGYRTPAHNKLVGGADASYHMRGQAADVTWENFTVQEAMQLGLAVGFDGIITKAQGRAVHYDTRGYPYHREE